MFGISKHTFQSMVRDGEKKTSSRSGFLLEGDVAHVERHLGTVLGRLGIEAELLELFNLPVGGTHVPCAGLTWLKD